MKTENTHTKKRSCLPAPLYRRYTRVPTAASKTEKAAEAEPLCSATLYPRCLQDLVGASSPPYFVCVCVCVCVSRINNRVARDGVEEKEGAQETAKFYEGALAGFCGALSRWSGRVSSLLVHTLLCSAFFA